MAQKITRGRHADVTIAADKIAMKPPRQTPYLACYCLLRAGESILLQRRRNTGYLDGQWGLPSGHADAGEDALAAASRELREETGLCVDPAAWRLVCAMHRRTSLTIIDLFFTTDRVEGTPRILEPDKCDGLAYFPPDQLPQPLIGYVAVAIDCLQGRQTPHGRYHQEGWA